MCPMSVQNSKNYNWLYLIEQLLFHTEGFIAVFGLALLLLLSLTEIVARNFLHTSIPGADILSRYLVLWVCFLGAVLAVPGRHIKIDIATAWISESWRARLERPIYFFSAVACGSLGWAATRFWQSEWQYATPDEKWIAALSIIIPISFFLLALHFVICLIIGPRATSSDP